MTYTFHHKGNYSDSQSHRKQNTCWEEGKSTAGQFHLDNYCPHPHPRKPGYQKRSHLLIYSLFSHLLEQSTLLNGALQVHS